jgi:hypothetical protein
MNSLKTVAIVIVLAVVAGAVYVLINNNSSSPTAPPELSDGWSSGPAVEVPDSTAPQSPFNSSNTAASVDASTAIAGSLAPPFSPEQPSEQALSGGMAPPFSPASDPDALASPGPPNIPGSQVLPAGRDVTQPVTPPPVGVRETFAKFMEAAHNDLEQGKLAEVHQTLSLWYDNPELSPDESRLLTDLLDQIAGTVVYSREHLLERPYLVKSGDTLQRVARAYGVPSQLLAKINGIRDGENLQPGREIKVVRGPFDAVIDLEQRELTLKLGGLYAGRFPVGIGRNQLDLEGIYFVQDKIVQSDEPGNPLGRYWIKLDDRIGIHGTNDPQNVGRDDGPGTICLGEQDIEDVHDILSIGSRVQILR